MYKCCVCGRQFQGGTRIDDVALWKSFQDGKRTYSELAAMYGCSVSTIQRRLRRVAMAFSPPALPASVVIMDTTYFGRSFGVMLFQDAASGIILERKYVSYETNALYLEGLERIRSRGTQILGVVCDGHKGLLEAMGDTPAQMCQFHMIQIIRRLLTKHPHLIAGRELLTLCNRIVYLTREEFTNNFQSWEERWHTFLNERTLLVSGKTTFTHRRLRAAVRSIKGHLLWLFTFREFPELHIPNTTNKLEGTNSELKRKLHSHNGLTIRNKKKFIDGFLQTWERLSE